MTWLETAGTVSCVRSLVTLLIIEMNLVETKKNFSSREKGKKTRGLSVDSPPSSYSSSSLPPPLSPLAFFIIIITPFMSWPRRPPGADAGAKEGLKARRFILNPR